MRKSYSKDMSLRGLISNPELVNALTKLQLYTVEDLIHCPFQKLLRSKSVLRNWDRISEIIVCTTGVIRQNAY